MRYNDENPFIQLAIYVVLLAAALACFMAFGRYQCTARWQDSGMANRWGLIRGCQIEVQPGLWIPEDKVREITTERAP